MGHDYHDVSDEQTAMHAPVLMHESLLLDISKLKLISECEWSLVHRSMLYVKREHCTYWSEYTM